MKNKIHIFNRPSSEPNVQDYLRSPYVLVDDVYYI